MDCDEKSVPGTFTDLAIGDAGMPAGLVEIKANVYDVGCGVVVE